MQKKKILAMLLALCMVLALVACKTPDSTTEPTEAPAVTDAPSTEPEATAEPTAEPEAVLAEQKSLAGKEYGKDYISLYEQCGKEVTIADVEDDPDSGFAYITKDGVKYDVYTFTRTEPLKAGAMTEWNVWNFIGINKTATSADIQKAIAAGAIKVAETDGGAKTMTLNVLVEADAIQAEGFAAAAAAWAAFN